MSINTNFDMREILKDKKTYEKTKKDIESIIMKDFSMKDEDVFVSVDTFSVFDMSLGNLLTVLILAKPFNDFNVKFTEDFLLAIEDLDVIVDYFNLVIEHFTDLGYDVRESLLDVISDLAVMSSKVLGRYGATINLYDITRLMKENKEFKEIIDFSFKGLNKNLQFEEMNKILDEKLDKLLEILKNNENCFKNLILSKSGISDRQLRETMFSIGPKPDDKGNIIPEPVDTSYIKGQTPFQFLIDAYGGRKALITNFKNVKDSGFNFKFEIIGHFKPL